MRDRQMIRSMIPIGLALLGAVIAVAGSGYTSWGLAMAWIVGLAAVAIERAILRPDPPMRVFTDLVGLVLTLVVLAPLGGWWFAPAVATQLFIDYRANADLASRPGDIAQS